MELPDHTVLQFVMFWGISILFSKVAVPIYVLTQCSRVSFSPYPWQYLSFCWLPFWQVWCDSSSWFWFAFPRWLVMSSIFRYARWQYADWGQEKGTTEDEVAGWHHRLNGREFGWTPGVGDGQGGLACCGSWGHKELDTTEWQTEPKDPTSRYSPMGTKASTYEF